MPGTNIIKKLTMICNAVDSEYVDYSGYVVGSSISTNTSKSPASLARRYKLESTAN